MHSNRRRSIYDKGLRNWFEPTPTLTHFIFGQLFYLAPFPEECRGTLNIRVQPVSVSTLNTKYPPPPPLITPHMKTINDRINNKTKRYKLT